MKIRKLAIFNPIRHELGQSFERDAEAYPNMIRSAIKLAEMARNMKTPLKKRIVLYPPTQCGIATGTLLAQLFHAKLAETSELLPNKPHDMYCSDETALAEVIKSYSREYEFIILVTNINHATTELFLSSNLSQLLSMTIPGWQTCYHTVIWDCEPVEP
ncbi:hypothetical protein HGA34_05465 [Candidatus Falkowbacteria bacterium]|nr:hypothetical protein [Candidatus Falkowbacteria bacterium]